MKVTTRSAAAFLLISFLWLSNSTGTLPEHTGAPGEMACGRAACHNAPVNVGSAQVGIDVDGGSMAYRAGDTLAVTVSIAGAQSPRNGFQITVLDAGNNFTGAWILNSPNEMQTVNGLSLPRQYVTHQAAGNLQDSWTMGWVAPGADAGDITFYASVLDGNDDGAPARDFVYTTSATLSFEPMSASGETLAGPVVRAFPNPATDIFLVDCPGASLRSLDLTDMQGQLIRRWPASPGANRFDITGLPPGVYVLSVETAAGKSLNKIVIY